MTIRIIKKIFSRLYLKYFNKPTGIIYMLHRVCPFESEKLAPNENMKITPEFLDSFILQNKEKYEFVSLDEVELIFKRKRKYKKPFIAFTLDDGYLDNYLNAFPIFSKHNVPFSVYIATDFPDKKAILWWYQLEDIIINNNQIHLSNGEIFDCKTIDTKIDAFMQIRKIILELPTLGFQKKFELLFSNYELNLKQYILNLALSWEQINEMSKNPLCTIGAHTITHRRLSQLNEEELVTEIVESKKLIEKKTGKRVLHFSYPFGTSFEVNDKVVDNVKLAGFRTSTFAEGGIIRKHDKDTFRLKRIMLIQVQ